MTLSAISIIVFHDFKYFYFHINIFDKNTFTRNTSVLSFFIVCQFSALWFFLWCFTVMMICTDTLIAAVGLFFYTAEYTASYSIFIKLKIMSFPKIFGSTYDFSVCFTDYNLCLYCMSFLFS